MRIKAVFSILALLALSGRALPQSAEELERGFVRPPDSAKPHTWWHWMNGNITREGITLDLRAMKQAGVGGAQIFDVTDGILPGPVDYMSDEWRAMIKHAAQEADRLGLELCIHNCAGWSSSGGPWIGPDHAMQMVTVAEVRVKGPTQFADRLPQPPTRLDHYRDIALLAFPTPGAEQVSMDDLAPQVTASQESFQASNLLDGDPNTQASLPLRDPGEPQYIQFEFAGPFTARALSIVSAAGRQGNRGQLQVSDDGADYRKVADFSIGRADITRPPITVNFGAASGRFFRLAFSRERGQSPVVSLAEVRLEPGLRISNWAAKAGYTRADDPAPDTRDVPPEALTEHAQILDITEKMDAEGRLSWAVPAGDWTILRFGYTPTGKTNHPASASGIGLECDKLSREAAKAHFDGMLAKVIEDLGPLAGRSLNNVLIDSYEVGCQNWTPKLREEFASRRGYDPLPYLPAMAGRVVDSLDVSERFLWDFRKTLAELFADNYYGAFAEMCHEHGLLLSTEPYGNGNFDNLACGGRGDIPMTEFWVGQSSVPGAKLAGSVAHIQGQKYVGAESFTANPERGGWRNHPYALKALGDIAYCGGVNRFIFHRYAHQPWESLVPGMTMGPHGFHFERTCTWWDVGPAWLKYVARCQYLLQEGLFVADLCYLVGEGSPNSMPRLDPPPPPGHDWDACSPEAFLARMSVRDGRLVLPDGMSYEVLILPTRRAMTPALLRKVRDLIRDGATVLGPKPLGSPSLQGYPDADREVQTLADELWGPCDGTAVTENAFGTGKIIWGKPLDEVLASRGVAPDFEFSGGWREPDVAYIHRRAGVADLYFVCNQNRRPEAVECTFRVTGRAPELWHPDTGRVERTPIYRQEDGRTIVPLTFDPAGSVFVVFREPVGATDHLVSVRRDGESIFDSRPRYIPKLEIRNAVYGVLTVEQPDTVDVTDELSRLLQNGKLTVAATNALAGDPAPNIVKQLRIEYTLGGKPFSVTVNENQTASLPTGQEGATGQLVIRRAIYGVLPAEPVPQPESQTVDVTEVLAGMIEDGALSAVADNSLAGDPANLVPKQLRVEYSLDGKPYTKVVGENQRLELPDGTEEVAAMEPIPAPELTVSDKGEVALTAWEPGAFEATTAAGKTLSAKVSDLPDAVEIGGPWELRFPPKLGAPERATFEKLMSWTGSDEPGIKYFSGTATYVKDVDIPDELLGSGQVLLLDLGVVREIAQVRLNGKDLGILWKPPFRVGVTDAAKRGQNRLEVRVTNLWPNRLIGDEQLPNDREWAGGGPLKAWPDWLLEGKPRPPTGRVTFTTWQHYTKDSPLLESGLLGPVTLRVGRRVVLAAR